MSDNESWMQASDVLSVFPTCVWKVQLTRACRQRIATDIIRSIDELNPGWSEIPPGESWQSGHDLHRRRQLEELSSCINKLARIVLRFLMIEDAPIEITGCWANVNGSGAAHAIHSHPNNFLSGTYYVRTHEGASSINFHDPRPQTGIIRPPVTELTPQNTDQVAVAVRDGMLLLFPSYLAHSVAPNESGKLRISVSFNMMFSHYTERYSAPLWGDTID